MIIKIYWGKRHEFVAEEDAAFLLEASPDEAAGVNEGHYYFLVSRDAHTIEPANTWLK
jgi:hypothetical protein